jgi:soluble lytic murein transglycosylase-like protein
MSGAEDVVMIGRSTRAKRMLAMAAITVIALTATSGVKAQSRSTPPPERQIIEDMVRREALDLGVSVSLALAVARAESNFNPKAESHKGARGVMQVMPATSLGEYAIHPDLLWDPRVNIRLGLHFLGRLIRRYRGRVDLALSYYNGGSAVGEWPKARIIPVTAPYVRKVLELRHQYRVRSWSGGEDRSWTSTRRNPSLSRKVRATN